MITELGIGNGSGMELLLSVALGIGLSAACGFRVFVPLLGLSIAALSGHIDLASGFEWMGTWPALIAFAVATIVEIGAYFVPWLDNLLDAFMGPLAVIAGTMVTLSVVTDMSPLLRWCLASIGGGGVAALIQGATTLLRAGSTTVTGGLTNPILAAAEFVGSSIMTTLAMLLPLLAAAIAIIIAVIAFVRFRRSLTSRTEGS